MLVEVGPAHDEDGHTEAAEHDPGPSGPATPQSAVGCVDVFERLPSDPDGWDAGEDVEEEAEQAEGERRSARASIESGATCASWSGSTPEWGPGE